MANPALGVNLQQLIAQVSTQVTVPHSSWLLVNLNVVYDKLYSSIGRVDHVMCVPGHIYGHLDTGAKAEMIRRLQAEFHVNFTIMRDGNHVDRFLFGPTTVLVPATDGSTSVCPSRDPAHPEPIFTSDYETVTTKASKKIMPKIPRPPNAYILYRKDHCRALHAQFPQLTNNEISKILGKAWQKESQEMRSKYFKKHEELKAALLRKHPDYHYNPRKAGEIKRRKRTGTVADGHYAELPLTSGGGRDELDDDIFAETEKMVSEVPTDASLSPQPPVDHVAPIIASVGQDTEAAQQMDYKVLSKYLDPQSLGVDTPEASTGAAFNDEPIIDWFERVDAVDLAAQF